MQSKNHGAKAGKEMIMNGKQKPLSACLKTAGLLFCAGISCACAAEEGPYFYFYVDITDMTGSHSTPDCCDF